MDSMPTQVQLVCMSESLSYAQLESYIREQMRMSHIYQPVMLRVLLEQGGTASIEDIAKALLSYDRSQVEYYEIRTKNMVRKVLTQNGIAEPIKSGRTITGYKLSTEELSGEEIATLKQRCDDRLNSYLEKRGEGI